MNLPDTDDRIRTALDDEAERYETPTDLFERITMSAKSSRRQRWLMSGGAIATAAAVVAVTVLVLSDGRRQDYTIQTDTPSAAPSSTTGKWEPFEAGPLAARAEPKSVWTGDRLIVIGGLAVERYAAFDDGAIYEPATGKWQVIARRPAPGRIMAVTWTGREVFALGQAEGIELAGMRSAHLYDPATNTWRPAASPPRAFNEPSAYWTGTEVLVWQRGGGALYDPASDRWREIPPIDAPAGGTPSRGLWLDREFAVLGSSSEGSGLLKDCLWLFDPATSRWRASAPPPRTVLGWTQASTAWTGEEVLVAATDAGTAFAYRPAENAWREIPYPNKNPDRGTGYFSGERIGNGKLLALVGSSTNPVHLWNPKPGTWTSLGAPPGPLPPADGLFAWIGSSAVWWGRDAETGQVNAAWRWRPA